MENFYTSSCCSNKGPRFEKMHNPGAIITEITVSKQLLKNTNQPRKPRMQIMIQILPKM